MRDRRRRATGVAVVLATITSLLVVAPHAKAAPDPGFTPVRYSFDSDVPGGRPTAVTAQSGDVEVVAQLPVGQGMRGKSVGGPWGITSVRLDRVIASTISVQWQETSVLGGDSHGFTLRHTEEVGGYLFLVNGLTMYEPNTVGIYKVRNGTARKLASANLSFSPRRTFIAEASGPSLTLFYSDTEAAGIETQWKAVVAANDFNDTITAGGLQYTAGWNGSDPTRTTIDDVTAYVLPVTGVVDLVTPSASQIVQRSTTSSLTDVTISGGYAGTPTAIQARSGTGAWETIDPAPASGRFSGVLHNQPTGQRTFEVRFANNTSVTDSSSMVGVGDVFVIAGQSNAVGHGWANQPVSHPTFRAGMFGNDFVWKPLVDPVDSYVGQVDGVSADSDAGGSVWPLIATKLMADQNVPVAFIPSALNGTWIGQWQRSSTDPFGAGSLYGSMARRARYAGKIRAVLFWQGESDAFNGMSKEQYRGLLDQFAADVRSDLGAPVVVAQIGEGGMPADNLNPVRLAQRESWDAGTTLAGPSLYDILPADDGVHFRTDPELGIAATRWWMAMRKGLYGAGDGRGPQLLSASLSPSRTAVTVKLFDASAIAGGTQGFSVAVGGSKVTIASVSRPADDAFVLNLASPAGAEPVTVSLGKGHDAAGKQVPADAGGLPAEVFVDAPVS